MLIFYLAICWRFWRVDSRRSDFTH